MNLKYVGPRAVNKKKKKVLDLIANAVVPDVIWVLYIAFNKNYRLSSSP
jgi:hypothetical protein